MSSLIINIFQKPPELFRNLTVIVRANKFYVIKNVWDLPLKFELYLFNLKCGTSPLSKMLCGKHLDYNIYIFFVNMDILIYTSVL